MSLNLNEKYKYTEPYYTNWFYLHNMTAFQMKALKGMEWKRKFIGDGLSLGVIPDAQSSIITIKDSVKAFIERLNEKIMEL
jgi:hypothetical protein